MSDIRGLIDKLNGTCRAALERAAELCVQQTHYSVELEHFLLRLLDDADNDLPRLLGEFDLDPALVARQLDAAMAGFKRGNNRTPALSPQISALLQDAWVVASLTLEQPLIRSGAVLSAALEEPMRRGMIYEAAPALMRLPRDALADRLAAMAKARPQEDGDDPPAAGGRDGGHAVGPALDAYTLDLTAQADAGAIDPIRGRDDEIRQVIDILMRRRQNNPILVGDPGVGKTAIVEAFACRVAAGEVPPALAGVSVRVLDLGLLQAGTGLRGEFETRLKSVIGEVKASLRPIILFVDEAHGLIGAGGQAGHGDAANLLKPALARGELRTIAATSWGEYKRYFEKDPALARRFQLVRVDEPSQGAAVEMLRAIAPGLEKHHGVRILDAAIAEAVSLSHRYIAGRQLPDKAISLLDTVCARVAIARHDRPVPLEEAWRRSESLQSEIDALQREQRSGLDHAARIEELSGQWFKSEDYRRQLEARWRSEQAMVQEILDCEAALEADPEADGAAATRLDGLRLALAELQQDAPMVPHHVDPRAVASVVAGWTGIPVGQILTDEIGIVMSLKEHLTARIVGQPNALDAIARRVRTRSAHLEEPGKPAGVFLLVGPSGVGKTETATALADLLYGGERTMITVNMSEYQEAYSVSGLKGAPPGYVGYGSGGVLTEAVRRRPYSVVLLDEVEKAHPDVVELFYQVFDKGVMEDGEGQTVDFSNTMIFLTSNVGAEAIAAACRRRVPSAEDLVALIRPHLLDYFKPAILGRLVVVPYVPLGEADIREIVRLKLRRIQDRFAENHQADLLYDEAVVDAIAARCKETDSGARAIDNILTHGLLPDLSGRLLTAMADQQSLFSVHVGLDPRRNFTYSFRLRKPSA